MRRTREEAEETRQAIMAAALRTFEERGISKTTLEHIALAAGVTRGAIYHHFVDKQAILAAIREAVSLPLIDRADFKLLSDRGGDPLERVQRFMLDLFRAIEEDATMRRAFAVMSFKCEYVGELEAELDEYVRKIVRTRNQLTEVYADAKARGDLRGCLSPELAALETTVFLAGLMRLCLLDDRRVGARQYAPELIHAHVTARRAASG